MSIKTMKFKKIISYVILVFIAVAITISFAVPKYVASQKDVNTLVIVNEERISKADFARFADSVLSQYGMTSNQMDERMQEYIIEQMISQKLSVQLAEQTGVNLSDDYTNTQIKRYFKDENGKFKKELLDNYLASVRLTEDKLRENVKESMIQNQFSQLISYGSGAAPDEVEYQDLVANSKLQIKYIFISNEEIMDRYKDKFTVSDEEIDKALLENPDEISDPSSDRAKMKRKLLSDKFDGTKEEFIKQLSAMANSITALEEISEFTGAEMISESAEFVIGGSIVSAEDKDKRLDDLSLNTEFYEKFIALSDSKNTGIINVEKGIYVFSPVKSEISHSENFDVTESSLKDDIAYKKMQFIQSQIITRFQESSIVKRNN